MPISFNNINIHINPQDSQSISWGNFCNLLDKIQLYFPVKNIKLLGKEPLLWEHFEKAIQLLHERNIQTNVLSNGKYPFKILPYKITVDLDYYVNHLAHQESIQKNLHSIVQQGSGVDMLYFFEEETPLSLLKQLLQVAQNIGGRVVFLPKHTQNSNGLPYKDSKKMAEKIKEVLDFIHTIPPLKNFYFQYPTTTCLSEYIEENKNHFNFSCNQCPLFAPSFHTDGQTVSFCPLISEGINLRDYSSMIQLKNDLEKNFQEKKKKNQPLEKCSGCKYYQKLCQGGCLA